MYQLLQREKRDLKDGDVKDKEEALNSIISENIFDEEKISM